MVESKEKEAAGPVGEILCGLGGWRPECLRGYATPRMFLIVYGLLGTVQSLAYVYLIATLTTLEKRFKIPSKTTGIMLSGNEVSQIMLSLFLTYFGGQGRRPLWIAWGVAMSAASCFILAMPHFVFGPGPDAYALTEEYLQHRHFNYTISQSEQARLCSWVHPPDPDCLLDTDAEFTWLSAGLVFLSQFVLGIGTTLYFSLGQTYLDDNAKKTSTPMLLGLTMALRTIGPAFGFLLASACLSLYVDPSLTPVITNKDPRWLGAWWLGWVVLGTVMFLFAFLMAMFPIRLLKKTKKAQQNARSIAMPAPQESEKTDKLDAQRLTTAKSFNVEPLPRAAAAPEQKRTMKEFPAALMRLLRNKLLMVNIWSGIFYILGGSVFFTYITKYMEVQFDQSSSRASIVTAPLGILAMMVGFIGSGWVISRWKPRAVYVLSWNVVVGLTFILSEISFTFIGCPELTLQGYRRDQLGRVDLRTECNANCDCQNVKYDPVCYEPLGLTFYSACHAGCSSSFVHNEIKMYDNCTCVSTNTGFNGAWRGPGHGSGDSSHHHQYFSVSGRQEDYNSQGGGYNPRGGYTAEGASYNQGGYTPWPQVSDKTVRSGTCDLNCQHYLLYFICITVFMNSLGCSGKVGNLLVNYRAVDPQDKAFAQGLSLFLISIFAFIPGPILFGAIIDTTCLVWDEKCGRKGNCWLYDKKSFRLYLNSTAAALTSIGVILDAFVCYLGNDIQLYLEDDPEPPPAEEQTPTSQETTDSPQKYTSVSV